MTIKNLYPTSRPSLDLNFAQTKRLDPRVTFSRASSGTYFDANGVLQSAATNVARFDHNPTTGESLGLLVEEARTNLITYSDYFTGWSFTSSTGTTRFTIIPDQYVSPDNTINGDFIRETTANGPGYYQRTLSISAGSYFSISCYVYGVGNYASNTARRVILGLFPTSSGSSVDGYTVAFNLFSSTVTSSRLGRPAWDGGTGTSAVFTETGSKITNVGNGWRKIEVYGKCSVANPIIIFTTLNRELNSSDNDGGGAFTMTGDGSSGIGVWGFQAEAGSFPTSYIPTPATFTGRSSTATFYDSAGVIQTAASGVARSNAFLPDSNGVFRSAGLLLEAAATNLVTYSEQFDNAAWTKDNVTVTANAVAAPDGLTTADKLVEGTGSYALAATSATTATSVTHTTSVFVKSAERTACYIRAAFGGAYNWVTAKYDLVNGLTEVLSGSSSSFTAPTSSIQKLPNGWWRISCTYTGGGGSPRVGLMDSYSGALDSISGIRFYGGNGTSGIFVWGAQLETGSYPTSYIPTSASTVTRAADTSTSATVTRSADVAQITGTNFSSWYNQSQGTIASSFFAKLNSFFTVPWLIGNTSDGLNNNYISLNWNSGGSSRVAQMYGSSVGNAVISLPPITATPTLFRNAFAVQSQNCAAATNGVFNGTSTVAAMPPSINTLYLSGQGVGGGGGPINGTISRFTYWPTRLSDATLQTITR